MTCNGRRVRPFSFSMSNFISLRLSIVYIRGMKLHDIIETILRTDALKGKRIELAALCARDNHPDAIAEVTEFWLRAGGTVDDARAA